MKEIHYAPAISGLVVLLLYSDINNILDCLPL